jgi:hypothetical protein
MAPEADDAAPGAAITVALCGHLDHEPPCPLAPHATSVERRGHHLHVRTLFAVDPDLEPVARGRIEGALTSGRMTTPDGGMTAWRLVSSERAEPLDSEADHAGRLVRGTATR